MQTTKENGAVASKQRTPTDHVANSNKPRWNYKGGFDRARLPSPNDYFTRQGLKLTGGGEWKNAICPFHEDSKPSLRVHLDSGAFKCMSCGTHGGDVLAFHMQRHGQTFKAAAIELGAWIGGAR